MLPLFTEDSKSVAMIMHAMRLIKQSINFLNPGQIPIVALDQPLYAIAKKVQWTWPNEFGDHFVVVLGGLHVEMAFMSMIGDVLEGSGWIDALINSGHGSPGVVESFLSSSHVKHTRYAHEVTACTLYSLLRQAYQESVCDPSFDDFCDEQTPTVQILAHCNAVRSNFAVLFEITAARQLRALHRITKEVGSLNVCFGPYKLCSLVANSFT